MTYAKLLVLTMNMLDAVSVDDPRIGTSHTRVTPDRGFGGHCLPKDTKAITYSAGLHDVDLSILQEAINYNNIIREDID